MLKKAKSVFFIQADGGVRVDEKPISRRTSLVESDVRYEAWVDKGVEVIITDKLRPNEPPVHVNWSRVVDYQLIGEHFERPEAESAAKPAGKPSKSMSA